MESSSEVKRSTHVISVQPNETVLTALPYGPHSSLLEFLKGEPKVLGVSPRPLMGLLGKETMLFLQVCLQRCFSEKTLIPSVSPHLSSKIHPSFLYSFKKRQPVYLFIYLLLFAALGLSFRRRDLFVEHGLLVVPRGFSSCGMWAQLLLGMWGLNSLTRGWTCIPCTARQILNH